MNCTLPPEKLAQIPEDDRKMLLEEASGNPSFCEKVNRCMRERSDWGHVIAASAKEAIANELDPSKFSGRREMWPKLRARTQELLSAAQDTVRGAIASMTFGDKVAVIGRIGSAKGRPSIAGLGALGQWDVIASLVGTIGKLGSDIYTTRLIADTKEDIARIQATSAMNALSAQQSIARAQASMAAIQSPIGAAISTFTTSTVGGIPVLLIAIPLVGGLIYMFTKK